MKILFIAMLSLSSVSVFAQGVLNIICDRPGIQTVNQFDIVGSAEIAEDGSSLSAVFQINTRRQGKDSAEEMHLTEMFGSMKKYAPGAIGLEEVVHLQFVDKGSDVEYVSIVGNHPETLSSQVRMKNGVTYRSKCYVK